MLGCISLNAQTPAPAPPPRDGGEVGVVQEERQNRDPGGQQPSLSTSSASPAPAAWANNASRRSMSTSVGTTTRRRSSLRSFCRKLGKIFSRRSSSSNASTTASVGFDSRNRLRQDFRQRILAALSSNEPSFVSAGSHSDSPVERRGVVATRGRRLFSQSDQVWQEIQDFAISQQGDVYVYIPYTHLNEALNYLSQVLPILSLSLREQQKQEGLTREEFESLPVFQLKQVDGLEDDWVPVDCPVCFHPMLPEEELVRLPCFEDHIFHKSCLWKWLSTHSTCPLCREKVDVAVRGREVACPPSSSSQAGSHPHSHTHSNQINGRPLGDDDVEHSGARPRRIFIWSTARSSTPAILILSRGQR